MTRTEVAIFKSILPPQQFYMLQNEFNRQQAEAYSKAKKQKQNADPYLITIDKRQVKAEVEKVLNEVFKELGFK